MRNLKISALPLLAIIFALTLFTSCQKDGSLVTNSEIVQPIQEIGESNALLNQVSNRSIEGLEIGCLEIQYPFELLTEEGDEILIESDDDFIEAMESEDEIIDFVYPLDVIVEGEETTVADGPELGELFSECIPDDGWNEGIPAFLINMESSCYDLIYPVTLLDLDGGESIANNEQELVDYITESQEPLFFEFPLNLVDEDGEEYIAENANELLDLLILCEYEHDTVECPDIDIDGGFFCFELVYPFTVVDFNGDEHEVEDFDEFLNVIMNNGFEDFVYPITIINEDDEEIQINSPEELDQELENCPDWGGEGNGNNTGIGMLLLTGEQMMCFEIQYPVSVTELDGNELEVSSSAELIDRVFEGAEVGLPVEVLKDGDTVVIESEVDLFDLLEECEG